MAQSLFLFFLNLINFSFVLVWFASFPWLPSHTSDKINKAFLPDAEGLLLNFTGLTRTI